MPQEATLPSWTNHQEKTHMIIKTIKSNNAVNDPPTVNHQKATKKSKQKQKQQEKRKAEAKAKAKAEAKAKAKAKHRWTRTPKTVWKTTYNFTMGPTKNTLPSTHIHSIFLLLSLERAGETQASLAVQNYCSFIISRSSQWIVQALCRNARFSRSNTWIPFSNVLPYLHDGFCASKMRHC